MYVCTLQIDDQIAWKTNPPPLVPSSEVALSSPDTNHQKYGRIFEIVYNNAHS